jgi:ankyrin repeat protein
MYMTILSVTIAFVFSPQYGDTALHEASSNGHPEVLKLLLQSHADVNVKNRVSINHFTIV